MQQVNEKTARILEWRESLVKMPDFHFFELIRMYLGEIQTPYNKQKLVEELSAFLRKENNRNVIAKLLSEDDVKILTAVNILSNPTQEKLTRFFSSEFSFAALYEKLLNLEERLLIYKKTVNKQLCFSLNPLLEEVVLPYLNTDYLFPCPENSVIETFESLYLTPNLLGSVFSFFFFENDTVKADGSLKKRTETLINGAFPFTTTQQGFRFFTSIIESLKNLQLLVFTGTELKPDINRWLKFSELDFVSQITYLCTASCGLFSKETLQTYSQLILDIISSIPKNGFSFNVLLRLALIQSEKMTFQPLKQSRLASLLQESQPQETNLNYEDLLSKMSILGLITKKNEVYVKNEILFDGSFSQKMEIENLLTIDADFSATLLPGASLRDLLPLVEFMKIVSYDTVPQFEISRFSCTKYFDLGKTNMDVVETIASFSSHQISQSLSFSIEDWYKTYQSVSVYKGYVLKASEEKWNLIEKNEILSPFIQEILSPGIYLLHFADDEEAQDVLKKSGLDFVGAVKQNVSFRKLSGLLPLRQNAAVIRENISSKNLSTEVEKQEILNSFLAELEVGKYNEEQIDGLKSRINRNIIINSIQLRADSVRFEKIEASGMDFSGKIHVIDHAISSGSMLELSYEDEGHILGLPVSLEKKNGDALLKIQIEPSKETEILSVSKANFVKRIRGSIFKETYSS